MARSTGPRALGKRGRCSIVVDEQEHADPPRTSKRLKEKRDARAERHRQLSSGSPGTTIRNGLATPETSSLGEPETSPGREDAPYERKGIFPFMQLPAELRIHIYHMALHRNRSLVLHIPRDPEKELEDERPLDNVPSNPIQRAAFTRILNRQGSVLPPDTNLPSDPIVPTVLRLNQQIYKESRSVLYSTNTFTLLLASGVNTLSTLHQRSRSLIKHVVLAIPSHHDILDGFADLVRLGLRYCWGLKTFKIILQGSLPDDGRLTHASSVYANAFHILRWLPRGCSVVLEGNVSEVVRGVVREEGRLQVVLDDAGYAKRQHQMPERH